MQPGLARGAPPTDTVSQWMSAPARYVLATCSVVDCAAIMLKHKVHRLPVVAADSERKLAGVVTRTDVFGSLLSEYK